MADRVNIRHLLGDTLQYVNGKIDVIDEIAEGGGTGGEGITQEEMETYVATQLADVVTTTELPELVEDVLDEELATYPEMSAVDIRRFVPEGESLSDANIDAALADAITWAFANTAGDLSGGGYVIKIPAGEYNLGGAHGFPAFGEYRCAIGLEGEGMNATVLHPPATGTGTLFTFGNASTPDPADVPFTMYLRIRNLTITPAGGDDTSAWNAITVYGAVNPLIEGVRVRGFSTAAATHEQGIALQILPAVHNGVEVNSQFVVVRDCDFSVNMTGLVARLAYPLTLENVHCQGNHFEDAIIEACLGTWKNSGAQFQGNSTLFLDRWHGGRRMPSIVTGYSRTTGLDSGTGATCGAASGNLCLVTGLTGLDRTLDRGRWLELGAAGTTPNELKVQGIYKIDSVVGATSCYIRKGSDHTSQSSLSWQVREAQAGTDMVFDGLYDEGSDRAMFGFWRDSNASGAFTVKHPLAVGQDYIVEADGVQKVRIEDPMLSNVADKIAWIRMTSMWYADAPLSSLIVDDYSYPGGVWQANDLAVSGRTVTGMRDAGGVNATRWRDICRRMGAVEIFDTRVASSVSLSGADVLEVEGLIHGSLCVPSYAGREAQWVTNDAAFGTVCIANVEGATNVDGAGMRAVIDSDHLPDHPYTCTVVLIGRLESATPLAAEARRVEVRTTDLQQKFALADGTWINDNLVLTEGTATGNALTAVIPDVDTAAHCWIWGRHPNHLNVISSDDGEDYRGNNSGFVEWASHTVGEDLQLRIADGTDAIFVRPFRWSAIAVFARGLSHAETLQIMGAARGEWNLLP